MFPKKTAATVPASAPLTSTDWLWIFSKVKKKKKKAKKASLHIGKAHVLVLETLLRKRIGQKPWEEASVYVK